MVYYKSVNYQCVNMRGKIAGHCEKNGEKYLQIYNNENRL